MAEMAAIRCVRMTVDGAEAAKCAACNRPYLSTWRGCADAFFSHNFSTIPAASAPFSSAAYYHMCVVSLTVSDGNEASGRLGITREVS